MNILSKEQISALPEWLPIQGFEGLYEVNCREGIIRNSGTLRVLKPSPNRDGYPRVVLYKGGKRIRKTVHRIVANAAFGYYNISTDGLDVCHLDEERVNPKVSNLALGTAKENMNFPKLKQRNSEAKRGKPNIKLAKRVGAYKNGELILKFESINEAGRNGFSQGHVTNCCLGKRNKHKGYVWKYLTA